MNKFAFQNIENSKIWQSLVRVVLVFFALGFIVLALQSSVSLSENIANASTRPGSVIFGPEVFSRSTGKPTLITRNFSVSDPVGSFWLQVDNGRNGKNLVSAAIIRLNGELIATTADFNQHIFGFSRDITLQEQNTLEIELRSIPQSFLTITIRRAFPNPDITNTKRDFGGLNDGTTIAFAWSPATNGVFEYVLFRSEFLNGPFMEIGRLPANRSPNAVDTTPDVRVKDLCYKLEARDANNRIIREYQTICVPKFVESSSHEVTGLENRTSPNAMCLQENQFTDISTISPTGIRNFLASRNSFLQRTIPDVDGVDIDPAQIIFDNAQNFQINPQAILATIEKEQRAITATNRLERSRLELITGFCPNDPNTGEPICKDVIPNPPRTIRDQIRFTASQFRLDLDRLAQGNPTGGGWRVNLAKITTDGVSVKPVIKAVATLFSYTPEAGIKWGGSNPNIGGNFLFCSRWALFDFPIPPQPVTLNQPTDITATSLKLSWSLPQFPDPDFLRYKTFRSITAGVTEASTLVATITNQSQTEFTDSGLTPNTTFFYKVFVFDKAGLSTPSNEVSATTKSINPIESFDNLNSGELVGQHGWFGDTGFFSVQSSTVAAGSKAAKGHCTAPCPLSGAMTIQRNFSPVITSAASPATISFYLRADNPIPGPVTVAFRQDALPVFFLRISRSIFDTVRFSTTGAGAGPFEDLAPFQPGHWYFAEIEADIPNQRARARIDSGSWSDWLPFTTTITQIDRALIQIGSAFQITTSDIAAYFDELRWRGE